ncbi:uncharacterized protein LOC136031929 [Artemia franciscana]|uniref:uncharacterized protein LOC136031929 n=1 Tax=Artemia franciscana TaxID=6661 RepID=UPI0032DBE92B
MKMLPKGILLALLAPIVASHVLNENFEDGAIDNWTPGSYSTQIEFQVSETSSGPAPQNSSLGNYYLVTVGSSGTATLRSADFELTDSLILEFDFWLKSLYAGSNNIDVYYLNENGADTLISSVTSTSTTSSRWGTIRVSFPTSGHFSNVLITLYVGSQDQDAGGIDNIRFVDPNAVQTTTTEPSTIETTSTSTPLSTSTSSTTPDSETSTIPLETTVVEVSTTSPDIETSTTPLETTVFEVSTTSEPSETPDITSSITEQASTSLETTASPEPSSTTVEQSTTEYPAETSDPWTSTQTTLPPPSNEFFDFGLSTSGWSLNEGNGASWVRRSGSEGVPAGRNGHLLLKRNSFYTGYLTAESPLLRSLSGSVTVEVDFWMNGTRDDPAQLQIFFKSVDYVYTATPILNLNGFGNRPNSGWSKVAVNALVTQPDGLFQVVVQGALGQALSNSMAVTSVNVTSVEQVPWSGIWDIPSGNFNGWTTGVSQGAIWRLANETDAQNYQIPETSNGEQFLMVERFAARSGFVTMQSPMTASGATSSRLGINFWLRGTNTSPADLTVRIRSEEGELMDLPVLDLRPYSTSDTLSWVYVDASLPNDLGNFQIVMEAFVGAGEFNGIAVKDVSITTTLEGAEIRNYLLKF